MNVKTIFVASLAYLISSFSFADPISIDDLLPAPDPDFLSCTGVYGESDEFRISWAPIMEEGKKGPVKKYASEVNCTVLKENTEGEEPSVYGEVEVGLDALPADECPLEGDICSTSVPMGDLFAAVNLAVEEGDIVLDEGSEISDYVIACSAKVKGLNPPGKSQNHPQGTAPCDIVEPVACPAWSAEELADVGTHGGSTVMDLEDYTNTVYSGLYNDQEYGSLGIDFSINAVAFTGFHLGSQGYVAHYSHNPLSIYAGTTTPDPEKDTTRLIDVTEAEYEACKQELIDHVTDTNP